jgi:uncharacterized surface protein with fasciclin (FAS1) repeats
MIRRMKTWVAALGVVFLAACGGGVDHPAPVTIAETATSARLTALVAAATKAGLVPTLTSPTSILTVFASTDAAFTTLGFSSAQALVDALPAATLAQILQYHVVSGRATSASLNAGPATQPTLYTSAGAAARLGVNTTGGVSLTDAVLTHARVTQADVTASNSIVHVIDKVPVPPGVLNIVQMAQIPSPLWRR